MRERCHACGGKLRAWGKDTYIDPHYKCKICGHEHSYNQYYDAIIAIPFTDYDHALMDLHNEMRHWKDIDNPGNVEEQAERGNAP